MSAARDYTPTPSEIAALRPRTVPTAKDVERAELLALCMTEKKLFARLNRAVTVLADHAGMVERLREEHEAICEVIEQRVRALR